MRVYKHFKNAEHAEALAEGVVWLSTLEECRRSEDKLRGDSIEGTHIYEIDYASGTIEDSRIARFIEMSGSIMAPDTRNTFINCKAVQKISDAYVICTTTSPFDRQDLLDEFGAHYVEIKDIDLFHFRITRALRGNVGPIQRDKHGPVTYAPTTFSGHSSPPGELGFVKQPDVYATQNEYRFLWQTQQQDFYRGRAIGVSGIAELCTLHLQD